MHSVNGKTRAKLEDLEAQAGDAQAKLRERKLDLTRQIELRIQDACDVHIHEDMGFEKLTVRQLMRLDRYVQALTKVRR